MVMGRRKRVFSLSQPSAACDNQVLVRYVFAEGHSNDVTEFRTDKNEDVLFDSRDTCRDTGSLANAA